MSARLIEPQDDTIRALHRNQFAPRSSGLPLDYYRPSRADRIAGIAVTITMALIAAFIVAGLIRGWFA